MVFVVENSNGFLIIYKVLCTCVLCSKYVSLLLVLLTFGKLILTVGHCKRHKDVLLRNLEEQKERLEGTEYCRKKRSAPVQYSGIQGFLPEETCSTIYRGGRLTIIMSNIIMLHSLLDHG